LYLKLITYYLKLNHVSKAGSLCIESEQGPMRDAITAL